ncbi:MAG: zinc ABC transporter substrate-binding protein [Microbacteriaceae bacterium]
MKRRTLIPAFAAGLALLLAGCAGGTPSNSAAAGSGAGSGGASKTAIVASTDVYGDIASRIGGDRVTITSIIDDPNKDPHEFQASAQNQLALAKANIVIANGGGYDDFVQTMLSSAKDSRASTAKLTVLNATEISGHDQKSTDGGFNEHVWYDFPSMTKLADALAAALSEAQPASAEFFAKNATAFAADLTELESTEASLRTVHSGEAVAVTEPVPLYLLEAVGLVDITPKAFSDAIESGTDAAPQTLRETISLFDSHAVALLVYNEQSGGPQTDAVRKAAMANHIPAVPVTETLPAHQTYVSWMRANLDAIAKALGE